MTFAYPNLIWLLALVPLVIWFLVKAWRRRQELIAQFIPRRLVDELTVGVSRSRQKSKMILSVIVIVLVIIALARPQWGYEWDEATQKGLDILVAIDASRSMLATDVKPNRLERAKLAALDLMAMAKTDRIGLIAFAGTSFLQCPLTLDDNAFRQSVRALNPDIMPQGGTALADTISVALDAFAEEKNNHKILVLFTDGEDHQEYVLEMGEDAAKEELRIFTIGVGSPDGDLIPIGEENGQKIYLKDRQGKVVKSKLNEALLQQLAGMARGFYLNLNAPGAIETLYAQGLAPLPKSEINSRLVRRYFERFYWPLLVAIVLLLIEMFLPDHRRRRRRSRPTTAVAVLLLLFGTFSASATPAQAMKKYRQGDYAGALEEYEKLKQKMPNDHRLLFNAGTAAYKAGDLEKARRNFSAATATEDERLQRQVWQNLGNTFYRIGQDDEAAETKLSNWKTALKMYDLALKSQPDWKDAQHNRDFVQKMVKILEEQMPKDQQKSDSDEENEDQDDEEKKDDEQQQEGDKNEDQKDNQSGDQNQDQKDQQDQKQNQDGQDQKNEDQQSKSGEDEKKDEEKQQPQSKPGEDEEKKDEQEPKPNPDEKNDGEPGDQEEQAPQPIPLRLSRQQAEQLLDAAKARERTLIFNPGRKEKGKNQKNPILKTW